MDLDFAKRILVVGDIMLDKYVDTDVQRISPEAPVPVANIKRRWSVLGGAANVARNLASIGAVVTLCGVRANDDVGHELQNLLEHESIMAPTILVDDRPTTCKCRVLCQGQQLLRLDEESKAPLSREVLNKLISHSEKTISWAEGVILSDYGKGVFSGRETLNLAIRVINFCNYKGIPLAVDPSGTDWSIYKGASCLTPNTKELAKALGHDPNDYQGLCQKALILMQALNFERILLTRGPKGMTLLQKNGEVHEIATVAREVCDVSGAGDTVIAVLLAAVASGLDWLSSAKIANTAAGIVVGKVGTSTVSLEELLLAESSGLSSLNQALSALHAKLVSKKQLLAKVNEWRNHNDRIVFTNGCFDLLHPGHVKLLQEAASLGNRLIVAINSDASVKRLKGPDRPIQTEDARALVMAGMHGVDCVVIFAEDTPLDLIKEVKPDVLVKGGDYSVKDVVGADEVQKYGGSVHIAKLVEGFSTTGIVEAISE